MERILVVSDTHGSLRNLKTVLSKVGTIDRLIHLGDLEGGKSLVEGMVSCPTDMVEGNNDYGAGLPKEKVIEIGKYRIFLTHGHRYHVSYSNDGIIEAARERGCSIVMYGHTHVPEIEYRDGMTIINPGSLSLPRPYGADPSYLLMEIDREGEAHYTICYLRNCFGIW